MPDEFALIMSFREPVIWEVFVDEGNFSKQCAVLDPDAKVQIFSLSTGWDFRKRSDRQEFEDLRAREAPDHILFAPPCTAWSVMKRRNIWRPDVYERLMKEREAQEKTFFRMIQRTFEAQSREGKGATMEHPSDAESCRR